MPTQDTETTEAQIRNAGFAAWKNNLGWMDAMKGSRWHRLLQKEAALYSKALEEPDVQIRIEPFFNSLTVATAHRPILVAEGGVQIRYGGGTFSVAWRFDASEEWKEAADLVVGPKGDWVVAIRDVGEGAENYSAELYRRGGSSGKKPAWVYQMVGPFVAFDTYTNRVYLVEAEDLWYRRLITVDAHTGMSRKLLYEEFDPKRNCELIRCSEGTLFLKSYDAGKQSCWQIISEADPILQRLPEKYEAFVPVGLNSYFGRPHGSDIYEPAGTALTKYHFPSFKNKMPLWFSPRKGILLTRAYGKTTFWKWQESKKRFRVLREGYGRLVFDTWTFKIPFFQELPRSTQILHPKSKDGTLIPLLLVRGERSGNKKPRGLLVSAYGAYGLPTSLSTASWQPLLDMGWVLAFALVRGGGDHTDAWAEVARRDQKGLSADDLEACVRAAQRKVGVGADQTALFGRSAGGYLVGMMVSRFPAGGLFQMVYTQVPYVDVFQTTTNPSLPLTQLEYNEFGDPLHRLQNFGAILRLSPANTLPPEGVPRIFVLCRSGTTDREVLAYESAKWISRLRGGTPTATVALAAPKLLALPEKQGHFVNGPLHLQQQAADLALLDAWIEQQKSKYKVYKMAYNRKNRTERKNRKTERKSRKNERKSRRANRKSRKATRKNRK